MPSGRAADSRARGRGFDTYLRRVVSLSKGTFSHPKRTGNNQNAVASSRYD